MIQTLGAILLCAFLGGSAGLGRLLSAVKAVNSRTLLSTWFNGFMLGIASTAILMFCWDEPMGMCATVAIIVGYIGENSLVVIGNALKEYIFRIRGK